MRVRILLGSVTALLAAPIAGCGGGDRPLELSQPATVALTVTYEDGGAQRRAELHCGGERPAASGYQRRSAAALCREVRRLTPFLLREPAADRACAEIYGGPQIARIEGDVEGERVDRDFKRTDSCQIADWKRIEPLLPPAPS